MNHILKAIITMSIVSTILYLLGAFYNVSFDIQVWANSSREYVSIMCGILCLFIGKDIFDDYMIFSYEEDPGDEQSEEITKT